MDNNSTFNNLMNFYEEQQNISGAVPFANIISNKSFEKDSVFNNSPFGKNWDKRFVLADWENDKHNDDQPQSKWIYHLEKNSDGKKLIDLYQHDNTIPKIYGSDNDNLTDINIYYETDDQYNAFGGICFVKMNNALADYLKKYSNGRQWLVDEIVKIENRNIDAAKLREAIDYELDTGGGMDIAVKIGVKLVLELGEMIRNSKYKANVWNPNFKNYDPILPIGTLDRRVKKWNNFKKDANKLFLKAKKVGAWLAENIPLSGEFLQEWIITIVNMLSSIVNAIDEIVQAIDKILRILKIANAFIAGVINECIEMAAGIVDLVALLLTMTDKVERQKIKEGLENILESYLKEPSKIIDQIKEAFVSLQERYSSDNSEYQIAYQLGEDAVSVIVWVEFIVGIVKAVKNLPRAFKKLEAWVENTLTGNILTNEAELVKFVKAKSLKSSLQDIQTVLKLTGGRRNLAETILLSTKEIIEGKSVLQLVRKFGIQEVPLANSLSNYQARIWYTWQKLKIEKLIDRISKLEDKAKKAFELRNTYRTATRQYMKDRKLAAYLEEVEKNQEWEKFLN